MKCASVASGGLSTRPEWEQPFTGRFDFSMIEDRPLCQLLERLRDRGSLSEVFETRFERREWRFAAGGGEVLLMADRGTIEAARNLGASRPRIRSGRSTPPVVKKTSSKKSMS